MNLRVVEPRQLISNLPQVTFRDRQNNSQTGVQPTLSQQYESTRRNNLDQQQTQPIKPVKSTSQIGQYPAYKSSASSSNYPPKPLQDAQKKVNSPLTLKSVREQCFSQNYYQYPFQNKKKDEQCQPSKTKTTIQNVNTSMQQTVEKFNQIESPQSRNKSISDDKDIIIARKEGVIQNLRLVNQTSIERISYLNNTIDNYKEQLRQYQKTIEQQSEELLQFKIQTRSIQSPSVSVKQQQQSTDLQVMNERQRLENESLKNNVEVQENLINQLSEQLRIAQQQQGQSDADRERVESLKEKVKILLDELELKHKMFDELSQESSAKDQQIDDLKTSIKDCQSTYQSIIDKLKEQAQSKENQINEFERRIKELLNQIKELKTANFEILIKQIFQDQKYQKLVDSYNQNATQIAELRLVIKNQRDQIDYLHSKSCEPQSTNSSQFNTLYDVIQQSISNNTELYDTKNKFYIAELSQWRKKYADLQRANQTAKKDQQISQRPQDQQTQPTSITQTQQYEPKQTESKALNKVSKKIQAIHDILLESGVFGGVAVKKPSDPMEEKQQSSQIEILYERNSLPKRQKSFVPRAMDL